MIGQNKNSFEVFNQFKTLTAIERKFSIGTDEWYPKCDSMGNDDMIGWVAVILSSVEAEVSVSTHNVSIQGKNIYHNLCSNSLQHSVSSRPKMRDNSLVVKKNDKLTKTLHTYTRQIRIILKHLSHILIEHILIGSPIYKCIGVKQ